MSKYKILKDFQLTTNDKKIVTLKAKSFIIDYVYDTKLGTISLDPDVVEQNPEYFQFIDWKQDFTNFLKANKIPQPAILSKKLIPYIEDNFKSGEAEVKIETVVETIKEQVTVEVESPVNIALESERDALLSEVERLKSISEFVNKDYTEQENMIAQRLEDLSGGEQALSARELNNSELSARLAEAENDLKRRTDELKVLSDNIARLENDLNARERTIRATDINSVVEKAIEDYEKTIPWQYHRKRT